MSSTITRRLPLLIAALLLSGCAIGNHYDYKTVRTPIPQSTKKMTVSVAAVDQREDLLSGHVPKNYVGMTRGWFGIPFRVFTRSGQSLADDVAVGVADSLNQSGYKATALHDLTVSDVAAAKASLLATKADRSVLVAIVQWESDTMITTDLTTDIHVKVYNKSGELLSQANDKVTKRFLGAFFTPAMVAQKWVREESAKIFSRLFTTPKVSNSL